MSISPQGYNYQDDPKNVNPFFGSTPSPTPIQSRSIVSIIKTATVGLIDTYTITYTDNTTSSFTVTNGASGAAGVGISDIRKTGTSGLVDTYTIYFSNNTTFTFTVTNGEKGDPGVSPDVSVREIVGGHIVTITDAMGSESFTVMNGHDGSDGVTPDITISATQGGETVPVTKTGSGASQSFDFAFPGGGGGASGTVGWGPEGPATNIYPQINSTNKITTEAYSEAITGQTVSLQDSSWAYYYATADITVSVATDTLVQKASSLKNAPQDLNNMSNWTVTDGFNVVVDSLTDNTSTYTFSNITATIGYLNEDGQGSINGMSIKIAADASDGTNTIHVEGNMFANFTGTVGYRTTQTSQNLEVLTQ